MKTKRSKLKKRRTKKNQSGGNGLQSVTNYKNFCVFMDRKIQDELDISRDLDLEEEELDLKLKKLYNNIKDENTKVFIDKTIPKKNANIYEIDKAIETFKNYKAAQPEEEKKYFDAMVKKLDINYYRLPKRDDFVPGTMKGGVVEIPVLLAISILQIVAHGGNFLLTLLSSPVCHTNSAHRNTEPDTVSSVDDNEESTSSSQNDGDENSTSSSESSDVNVNDDENNTTDSSKLLKTSFLKRSLQTLNSVASQIVNDIKNNVKEQKKLQAPNTVVTPPPTNVCVDKTNGVKKYIKSLREWEVIIIEYENKGNFNLRKNLNFFMNEINKLFAQKVIIEVIGLINTKSESFIEGIKHGFSPLITKKILLSYMIKYVRTLNKKYNFSQDFLNEIPGYMEAEKIIQTREKETKEKNEIHSQFMDIIRKEPNNDFKTELHNLYDTMYNNNPSIKINSVVNLEKNNTMDYLKMSGGASDPRDLIAYLNSEEVTKEINDPKNANNKEAMLKRRNEAIEILKKQASTNHVDYEIDNFFRLFFPKASGTTAPPKVDDKKKVYETKEELITYMFSYPIDSDTFKEKGKEANQENNPFGFDMNVRRSDSSAWSEMMGIEAFLMTLNASGSNTNYFSEYYKKPMFTNKVTTTKRIPNYAYSGEKI